MQNPGWPGPAVLELRRQQALGKKPDSPSLLQDLRSVTLVSRIGRENVALPEARWPVPFDAPGPVDAEPGGRQALVQLMPATARAVASRIGEPQPTDNLTRDPAYNLRLGRRT